MRFRGDREAFGGPGIEPRWTHGNKSGIGTAYSADSKIWFTLWQGIVTEVYYPLIDHPQIRDLELLVTDGRALFQEEKRHLEHHTERISPHALGYRVRSSDPNGRYALEKEILTDPHLPCVLESVRVTPKGDGIDDLTFHLLLAPHLDVGGWGNRGYVIEAGGRELLVAERNGTWLALGATVPFAQLSCGFVGSSDGWTDLSKHFGMSWEFDRALDGNIALTGALDLGATRSFTVGLAFGRGLPNAVTTLFQSLGTPFEEHRSRFLEQWDRPSRSIRPLASAHPARQELFHASYSVLLAHEDKTFPGAFIASLSIPWGYAKSDDDRGGYHLVWTRDLVQIATGLLAAGDTDTPLRTLIYLAASQRPDGGFPQNFWIDGTPYWSGIQLDEVAFPILLAWRLHKARALRAFDPYPMVRAAARFLVEQGPATGQERWEESAGYSPSTLAVMISALVVAGAFARERGDAGDAEFLETYADFLERHVDRWTVTDQGTADPDVPRHFVRIHPVDPADPIPDEDPNVGTLSIPNLAPAEPISFPAKEIVDAGFLELVRYGVRRPDDPLIVDSLRVVDRLLKVDTPLGPAWRRYNHDGYGQRSDGGPFSGWGVGRAWPLLTGERGHYELAAGNDPSEWIDALERFASRTGMLPEQVWDGAEMKEAHLHPGRPTGAAMPLAWAHAEYIKLLRSAEDGRVFDKIPEVEQRYTRRKSLLPPLEIWKPNRTVTTIPRGSPLRVQGSEPFRLHWTSDGWNKVGDQPSRATSLGLHFVDLAPLPSRSSQYEFTFYWTERNVWEGRNFTVRAIDEGR